MRLPSPPRVVNVGLEIFADTLARAGAAVVHTDWKPPAAGDARLAGLLARLADCGDDLAANREWLRRVQAGGATLVGVRPAREVIPALARDRLLLHAGPPIAWERMCGPVRGAVIGACLFEGWARTPEEVQHLAESGALAFEPCHDHRAVGPMAGIVTPSMALLVMRNEAFGVEAYATLNEGPGKVLRYGAYDTAVVDRLAWMNRDLAPVLDKALARAGGIDVKTLIARAVTMGDECHNRNAAATSLLIRELAPHVAAVREGDVERALAFMGAADYFFLNLAMAACKAMLDPAHRIAGATIVSAMARNGTDFGIRVSGLGDRWFTAPTPAVTGLYFPGFGPDDANPDLGDSAITETCGLGAFAMAAAPAITQFVGGTPAMAVETTLAMYEIAVGEHEMFKIPALDFRGTPLGIDLRRVVETGIVPVIDTGIAGKVPGVGQVGAGVSRAPLACFVAALEALALEAGVA